MSILSISTPRRNPRHRSITRARAYLLRERVSNRQKLVDLWLNLALQVNAMRAEVERLRFLNDLSEDEAEREMRAVEELWDALTQFVPSLRIV